MAAPSPSLSLSDIMHPFSPPPVLVPHKEPSPPPRPRSSTPEPLEPAEIEEMRRKVLSMGWGDSSKGKEKAASREQELADMLLRITHPAALPQPSQLHAQAETIAHLIQQRDFLVTRSTEEHERWESEKEGWARAAHALIIQGRREAAQAEKEDSIAAQYSLVTTDASTQRLHEFERANSALQSDKKMLQQKLTDTQRRLASLESELAQLKPLLLMQPFTLTHSHPTGTARGWSATMPSPGTPLSTRRGRGARRLIDDIEAEDELESEGETPLPALQPRLQFRNPVLRPVPHDQSTSQLPYPATPQKPKGDYYRRRDTPGSPAHHPSAQNSKSGRRKVGTTQSPPGKTTLSDARSEHLLLAARKIGMQRATVLSGTFAHMQQPSEPSSHYKPKSPSSPSKTPQAPKTPRRAANANTPLLTRTPLGKIGTSPGQPRTPLQSLLSAAQSVLSAPGPAESSAESPLAKRRKLDHPVPFARNADSLLETKKERDQTKEKKEETTFGGLTRVKSGLDFLADQAEVYSTQPASQDGAGDGDSQPRDGEETMPPDAEIEDASQPTDLAESGHGDRLNRHPIKNRKRADKSMSRSRAGTPRNETLDAHDNETQQTVVENNSQDTTPPASLGAFTDPSVCFTQSSTTAHQTDDGAQHHTSTLAETLGAPLTLAPPINLTPRTSHSPAPRAPTANTPFDSRGRSKSLPAEHDSPRASNSSPLEASLQPMSIFTVHNQQPTAPPITEPSVLQLSSDTDALLQEGSSIGIASKPVEGIRVASDAPRRTRSPYIKWTKEEDELLAKAVAKHGQKWDLVQKALPSRGYHQVRQRWLRKLGMFDGNKLDLSSLETNAAAEFLNISTAPPTDDGRPFSDSHAIANPKLGLAPLNSERTLTTAKSGNDSSPPLAPGGSTVGGCSSWPAGRTGDGLTGQN